MREGFEPYAHHPWQLKFIDLALAAALVAKIPPERIVNFMPLKELRAWVEKVRNAEARRTAKKYDKYFGQTWLRGTEIAYLTGGLGGAEVRHILRYRGARSFMR